jgi:preprotein translocase subunit SecG
MYVLAIVIHLLISIVLCIVVLLQSSKGDGLAGAFGGGGAGQAVFGARGVTTILHKATIYLGAAFMISSVILVFLTMREGAPQTHSRLSREAAQRVPVESTPLPQNGAVPVTPSDVPAAQPSNGEAPAHDSSAPSSTQKDAKKASSQKQGADEGGGGR